MPIVALLALGCTAPNPETPETTPTTQEDRHLVPGVGQNNGAGNVPPSAPTLHIEPAAPAAGDTLTLLVDDPARDRDGDTLVESIGWEVDGAPDATLDGSTIVDGGRVRSGQVYRAWVTTTDGIHPPVVAEAVVTVENLPPVFAWVSLSPANPADDDALFVTASVADPDGDPVTLTQRWFRDEVEVTEVGNGAEAASVATSPGETWYVEVTASDGRLQASINSDPAAIAIPNIHCYGNWFTGIATPDGSGGWAGLTGTWELLYQISGPALPPVDCDAFWEVTGTADGCPGCQYQFEIEFVYDAGASTMNTLLACAGLEVDGTGTNEVNRRGNFSFNTDGPTIGRYNAYGTLITYGIDWYTYGYYRDDRYGRLSIHTLVTTEDSAGYLHVDAYDYTRETY